MSTVMKRMTVPRMTPPNRPQDENQLTRDRVTALIVVLVMAALMGLIIWLASLGGGSGFEGTDYWPMMP